MEAVELLSRVNEKFGSVVCSTSMGNFIVLLQENQVGLLSLRSDDFLKQYFVNVYFLMLWFVDGVFNLSLSPSVIWNIQVETAVRCTGRVRQLRLVKHP